MSVRLLSRLPVVSLIALFVWIPLKATAQEPLPSLDSPFLVPLVPPAQGNLFGDEKPADDAAETIPKRDSAGANTDSLNNLFSHQWVRTDEDQRLRGTVVSLVGQDTLAVSGTSVVLAQRGRIVAKVTTNGDGEFEFDSVFPGYYSIISQAENSFAAYGLAVMNSVSGSHLPNTLELRVIRPQSDQIRRILNADTIPTQGFSSDETAVRDPISAKRVFASSHRVKLTNDGRLIGHLSRIGMAPEMVDMSQMKAMLLKDGQEIARTDVSKDGAFEFQNVLPGCYGFAAAGNRGIAAVAFCVVAPEALTQTRSADGAVYVIANQESAASELNIELADTADVMSAKESTSASDVDEESVAAVEEEEELPLAQPMMPFGGSNMYGAGQIIPGGSSGHGMGGFQEIAGLALAGGIAYAIVKEFDDDDDVVSPIVQ